MGNEQQETIDRKARTVAHANLLMHAIAVLPMTPEQASDALVYLGIVMKMAAMQKDIERDAVYEIDHQVRHLIETEIDSTPEAAR